MYVYIYISFCIYEACKQIYIYIYTVEGYVKQPKYL